jgi:large subunit ribosomal protein L2
MRRDKIDVPAKVIAIEYDRIEQLASRLFNIKTARKRYILAPIGLKVNDSVVSGPKVEIRTGNAMPISNIPVGSTIHNIEMKPGKGGLLVRAAGSSAQLLAKKANMRRFVCRPVRFV